MSRLLVWVIFPIVVGAVLPGSPVEPVALVACVGAPLVAVTFLIPVIIRRHEGLRNHLAALAVGSAFALSFALRGLHLIVAPESKTFGNLSFPADWDSLYSAMLWTGFAGTAYAAGYLHTRQRLQRPLSIAQRLISLWGALSSIQWIVALYGIGWLGRGRAISTGGAFYLYNSPSFDTFAERRISSTTGVIGLVGEFCVVGFVAAILYWLSRPRKSLSLTLLIVGMFAGEILYYTFSLYKLGLLGVFVMPAIAVAASRRAGIWTRSPSHSGRRIAAAFVVIGGLFALLILPTVGTLRGELLPYYRARYSGAAVDVSWASAVADALAAKPSLSQRNEDAGPFDDFLARTNGAEAIAVGQKFGSPYGTYFGRTYLNFVTFGVPRVLRPAGTAPFYIPWERDYVGEPPGFNVVPMPMLVEAYLNFGYVGVVAFGAMLGWWIARLDRSLGEVKPIFWKAMVVYVVWKMCNIEHNAFVIILPLIKLTILLSAVAFVASTIGRRALGHHVRS